MYCLTHTVDTMEKEEGEMSDDNSMQVDEDPASISEVKNYTVVIKSKQKDIVVEKLEKVDAAKLEERAQRFGLDLTGSRVVTQKHIDDLYSNCGINIKTERHFRLDTLHLNGIDGLNAKEIFEYLEDYKPVSMEWVDKSSCNIICQDHIAAALALLVHSREIKSEELNSMLSQRHHWREGLPHPNNDLILMRFATHSDKKHSKNMPQLKTTQYASLTDQNSKNPWGDLCQTWGVYDHQEILSHRLPSDSEEEVEIVPINSNSRLANRLGKRKQISRSSQEDSDSESDWTKKSKTPRMRMHADDVESKVKSNTNIQVKQEEEEHNSFAPLSIEVVNADSSYTPREMSKLSEKFDRHSKNRQKKDIQSRLGAKVTTKDSGESDDSSEGTDYNGISSRVQKVKSNFVVSKSNIWSRLDQGPVDEGSGDDLRTILRSKPTKQSDLRERLGHKYKGVSLRIEIDNK